jgi:small-conductance mechanosensitive channel
VQNPFRSGDLVEIAGIRGYVEALNTRVTVLMTLEGNHVQIPNATVYKSNIFNYTSNPKRRTDFVIGIGYEDSISEAQEVALQVLEGHPAVLKDPEPLALVDELGASTVNLRIYFWIDGNAYSWLKVKSAVIRLLKRAFEDAGISMPDEAREMIFPRGVPVEIIGQMDAGQIPTKPTLPKQTKTALESPSESTKAEAGLSSEAKTIKDQAQNTWKPGDGENLLHEDAP